MTDSASSESGDGSPVTMKKERTLIYSVSLNRPAAPTVSRSTPAIKADAGDDLLQARSGGA